MYEGPWKTEGQWNTKVFTKEGMQLVGEHGQKFDFRSKQKISELLGFIDQLANYFFFFNEILRGWEEEVKMATFTPYRESGMSAVPFL